MKEALKKKWVAALRSGKFTQYTAGALVTHGGSEGAAHCCLGVLCAISPAVMKRAKFQYDTGGGYLPGKALEYAGFTAITQEELIKKNDNGTSFSRIATYIEKNL
jgi:hypothetical protein